MFAKSGVTSKFVEFILEFPNTFFHAPMIHDEDKDNVITSLINFYDIFRIKFYGNLVLLKQFNYLILSHLKFYDVEGH